MSLKIQVIRIIFVKEIFLSKLDYVSSFIYQTDNRPTELQLNSVHMSEER